MIEFGMVRHVSEIGLSHIIVDFQDDALGAVLVVGSIVLAANGWECVEEHVVGVLARNTLNVEVKASSFRTGE